MSSLRRILPTAVAAAALTLAGAGVAAAAVHPGAGYTIVTDNGTTVACTLADVTRLEDGRALATTAGHCGHPGQAVTLEATGETGVIVAASDPHGQMQARRYGDRGEDLVDFAIVEFPAGTEVDTRVSSTWRPPATGTPADPVLSLIEVPTIPAPLADNGVRDLDAEPVRQGEILCKDGRASGRTCGVALGQSTSDVTAWIPVRAGDSGGILYDLDGRVVGVTSRADRATGIPGANVWQRRDYAVSGDAAQYMTMGR